MAVATSTRRAGSSRSRRFRTPIATRRCLEARDRGDSFCAVERPCWDQNSRRAAILRRIMGPVDPEKLFVKRVIAGEGDEVRITSGRVYVNGVALHDDFVPPEYRSFEDFGPRVV